MGLTQLNVETGIGEKLRLAREARGVALREISEHTRISVRYLTAIEAQDFNRLPGGIFNRSFIRAYARYIGYDEKEALEGYAAAIREQGAGGDEVTTTPLKSLVYTDDSSHPTRSPLATVLLAILILGLLSLSVWAGLHYYRRQLLPKTESPSSVSHKPALSKAIATMKGGWLVFARPSADKVIGSREERDGFTR